MELSIHIPFNIYSICAIRAAREYFALAESQLAEAASAQNASALEQYRAISDRDEADYDVYVRTVDRAFEEDYIPALRYSNVLYLYLLFERHVSRHIEEIQRMLKGDVALLRQLKKRKDSQSLVTAVRKYFDDHAKLDVLDRSGWEFLQDFSHLRNVITHNAGVAKGYKFENRIYALESLRHNNEPIGIEIHRYKNVDIGAPVVLNRQFLPYATTRLEAFFELLGTSVENASFYS